MKRAWVMIPLVMICVSAVAQERPQGRGQQQQPPQTLAERVAGMQEFAGYFPFYWDAKAGKIWLIIDKWDTEFLYVHSLPAGLGNNDIGLDRGQLGGTSIVKFQRVGPRVLMVEPNYSYRATSDNPAERRAVEQAFAQSVLWGFEVAAEDGDRVLVDATAFYLRDAHNVVGTLRRSNQGQYRLDATRSAIYLPRTKNFPKNTEVEAALTFTSDQPGGLVRSVAPSAEAVTLRQHHSFFELPDSNYTPRNFDPRAGYGGRGYMDFAAPISEPIGKRFIARHRLQKKNPTAARSEAVEPIVYYVDRGAPEPIRTALVEGAQWWNQAFEAAGFINGFRVEVMPEDADPMDARYNVIQWVHRSTRGWSYGASVSDPRTGEIIKGHVTLGSMRVRQDFLIAEGLVASYEEDKPAPPEIERMALARIRQLSAHEVGHTLGLSHNYISSTSNRASVMDYPHPLAKLRADGTVDLSDAYAEGIGDWDKVAINWGYREFPAGTNERAELNKILMDAAARGIIFLTDQDARPQSSSHSKTHLWDNGENATDELRRVLAVRAAVLRGFSEKKIRPGAPMATIEDVLVPMYLFHRYQVEAAAKVVGGMDYTFTLRGDGQLATQIVKPEEQRRALDAVLEAIQPSTLALPEALIAMIPPRPPGYFRGREQFRVRTGATFDPVGAAAAAADLPVMLLLNAERAARMVEFHARDARNPGFGEVVDRMLTATWKAQRGADLSGEIRRAVDMVVLYRLMALAANTRVAPQVRAVAMFKLDELRQWLADARAGDEGQRAHAAFAAMQIELFLKDPKEPNLPQPPSLPDGAPIGTTDDDCSWVDVWIGD